MAVRSRSGDNGGPVSSFTVEPACTWSVRCRNSLRSPPSTSRSSLYCQLSYPPTTCSPRRRKGVHGGHWVQSVNVVVVPKIASLDWVTSLTLCSHCSLVTAGVMVSNASHTNQWPHGFGYLAGHHHLEISFARKIHCGHASNHYRSKVSTSSALYVSPETKVQPFFSNAGGAGRNLAGVKLCVLVKCFETCFAFCDAQY